MRGRIAARVVRHHWAGALEALRTKKDQLPLERAPKKGVCSPGFSEKSLNFPALALFLGIAQFGHRTCTVKARTLFASSSAEHRVARGVSANGSDPALESPGGQETNHETGHGNH
jgi:hypothetical protein